MFWLESHEKANEFVSFSYLHTSCGFHFLLRLKGSYIRVFYKFSRVCVWLCEKSLSMVNLFWIAWVHEIIFFPLAQNGHGGGGYLWDEHWIAADCSFADCWLAWSIKVINVGFYIPCLVLLPVQCIHSINRANNADEFWNVPYIYILLWKEHIFFFSLVSRVSIFLFCVRNIFKSFYFLLVFFYIYFSYCFSFQQISLSVNYLSFLFLLTKYYKPILCTW